MIFISHRGNMYGKDPERENTIKAIDAALHEGFDVEIDVWMVDDELFLGHDEPETLISLTWLTKRADSLWIHCKNLESLSFFNSFNLNFNYFFHDTDDATLTSLNFMWIYPGKQPVAGSIAVMPEINDESVENCLGICSDEIYRYRREYYELQNHGNQP